MSGFSDFHITHLPAAFRNMMLVLLLSCFVSLHTSVRAQSTHDYIITSDKWDTTLAECPQWRAATGGFIYKDKIHFAGGYWGNSINGFHYPDEIISYDPGLNRWDTLMDPSPVSRLAVNTIVIDKRIYILGGIRFSKSGPLYIYNSVDILDPANMTWQSRSSYPGHAIGYAVILNDHIYTIGGTNAVREPLAECFRYDPENDTWERITSLSVGRFMHQVIVLNGKIYVIGGLIIDDGITTGTDLVEVYDPSTDSWKTLTPFPHAGYGYSRFAYGGKIFVTGGRFSHDEDVVYNDTIFMYDPEMDHWEYAGILPGKKYLFSSVSFEDQVYFFGGLKNSETGYVSKNVWKLDLLPLHTSHQNPVSLSFHPNPSRGRITVHGYAGTTIRIFNMEGICVYRVSMYENRIQLLLDHLPRGVYVVQLCAGDQLYSSKLILH